MVFIQFRKRNFNQQRTLEKLLGKISCDLGSPTMTIEITVCQELYTLKMMFADDRKLYLLYAHKHSQGGPVLVQNKLKEIALLEFVASEAIYDGGDELV